MTFGNSVKCLLNLYLSTIESVGENIMRLPHNNNCLAAVRAWLSVSTSEPRVVAPEL